MAGVGLGNQLRSRLRSPQSMNEAKKQPQSTEEDEKQPSQMKSGGGKVAVLCFLGIFVSYFVYGLLQEKM